MSVFNLLGRFSRQDRLFSAVRKGDLRTVEALLQSGLNPNFTNGDNETPLMVAVEEDHAEVVRILLNASAEPEFPTNGVNAVHYAKLHGRKSMLRCFGQFRTMPQ